MSELKISAPWEILFNEFEALFGEDPEISVKRYYTEDDKTIIMMVDSQEKADALQKILPASYTFGNIVVHLDIKPANTNESDIVNIYAKAFKGNPVLDDILTEDIPGSKANFFVFRNEVCRFFADNIRDYQGKKSVLFEDIAADIFEDTPGIYFCTADSPAYYIFDDLEG